MPLEEVVVVGYTSKARKDLTGSVGSISGAKLAAIPVLVGKGRPVLHRAQIVAQMKVAGGLYAGKHCFFGGCVVVHINTSLYEKAVDPFFASIYFTKLTSS